MRLHLAATIAAVGVPLALTNAAWRQAADRHLVGIVLDQTRASNPARQVVVESVSEGASWDQEANAMRGYRFNNLAIGS